MNMVAPSGACNFAAAGVLTLLLVPCHFSHPAAVNVSLPNILHWPISLHLYVTSLVTRHFPNPAAVEVRLPNILLRLKSSWPVSSHPCYITCHFVNCHLSHPAAVEVRLPNILLLPIS
jgi:hypothetical protein